MNGNESSCSAVRRKLNVRYEGELGVVRDFFGGMLNAARRGPMCRVAGIANFALTENRLKQCKLRGSARDGFKASSVLLPSGLLGPVRITALDTKANGSRD
jgi:hypothetical protein